jgi:hypothetical protein
MKKFMLSLLLIVTVVSCAEAQQIEKKSKPAKTVVRSNVIAEETEDVQILFTWVTNQIVASWHWPQYSADYVFSFFINGVKKKLPIDWNKCFLPTDANTFQLWIQSGERILKSPVYQLVLEQKE